MLNSVYRLFDGYKFYLGCVAAMIALSLQHYGINVPGLQHVNDADYATNMYYAVMGIFGRSAMPDKKGIV